MEPVSAVHFGPFLLDGPDDSLWRETERCHLTAKAGAVLRYLVAHPGRLVRKADLLAAVWPDTHVSDWVLTTCIRELRQVLGDVATAPQYIATVHRQGYRFIAAVTSGATPLQPPRVVPADVEGLTSAPTAAVVEEEHKLVTILCGALAEAPTLAARLVPEPWYRLLQTVVELTQEVLHHYGGTLLLATSEGFTAVFGAPVAQEDHARRAVLAALELRQRLHEAPTLRVQGDGSMLTLSMGLHAGLVVVGALGQTPQQVPAAIGAPVHVATRLQQQAAPDTILLSAATYQLVQTEIQAIPCGTLPLDGQPTPMAVYAVQGLRQRNAGVSGWGARTPSPFVGRERELALLQDCLVAARAGQGQVVGLVGEAGMGKTRLVTEFGRRLAGQGVTVVVGQCLSYGQNTPYLPVRDLVRQLGGLGESAAAVIQTAAVERWLHAAGITAAEDGALLCHLLDLPVAPEALERLSPEAGQVRTFALLRHLVVHAAQRQPLVLVVENLHWIDPASAAWLLSLVERLAETTILLVGTCRPGAPLPWGAHAAVTQVALSPLRDADSRAVVQAVLGAAVLPEVRLRVLLATARGNPFFVEELAWHAMEHDQPDALDAVPETVHAVLAARMDRLPSEEKQLLQTAAVVGTAVPVPLLQVITALPETAMHRVLAHLQAAGFLAETQLFPEQIYTFKHALIQEVAYGSLLQTRRRALHAQIVAVLETLPSDRGDEQVDRLAHHALRGEVWDKAFTYCRQAGAKAFGRFAYRAAVEFWEQALEAVTHLPPDRPTLEQAIDVHGELFSALMPFGQPGRRLTHLRAAETLAEVLGDHRRLGRVCRNIAETLRLLQDRESALAYCQWAHTMATAVGDVHTQVWVNHDMSMIYYDLGNYYQAMEYCQQVLMAPQEMPPDQFLGRAARPEIWAYTKIVQCLSELGAFAEGVAYSNDARQIAEALGRPYEHLLIDGHVGISMVRQGALYQAIPLLEQVLALSQDMDFPVRYRLYATYLALAYALVGRATEALPLLRQIEGHFVMRGEAYLLAGEVEEADRLAQRGLTTARERNMRGEETRALWLLGEIALRRDPPDIASAAAYYQQALTLAEALGMRPLQAHCRLGLGTLYATTGQDEQARAALTTAIAMYRAMDMTFWLPQAEAALAQISKVDTPAA
jgi:class 3 adenylate cyclase/tetratricopeptide (TPR) repeat protein